jgi:hypothetical protein
VNGQEKKRKQFFFEKKNQKTFVPGHTLPERTATATQKSFASFLQKRSAFFLNGCEGGPKFKVSHSRARNGVQAQRCVH